MREEVRVLELDKYEINILINALNAFRNKLIEEKRETEPVDEVLLKAIDAPQKKSPLVKCLRKDDRR
jgi:hypothetical protein